MTFGEAIEALKEGKFAARHGWNDMWLKLRKPSSESDMTAPYIYMFTADEQLVPWLASQTDMLAEDWFAFE